MQKVLNYIAEIANNDSAIVANVFWFILFLHIGHVTLRTRHLSFSGHPEIVHIEYVSVLKTMLMQGIAMWVEWAGVVEYAGHRFTGVGSASAWAGGPMSPTQTALMAIGAILMIFGTIRDSMLSRRTGHSPWVASTVAVIATTFHCIFPGRHEQPNRVDPVSHRDGSRCRGDPEFFERSALRQDREERASDP